MSSLAEWLTSLGLERYLDVLVANDIDLEVLSDLSEQELSDLGFSLGHRKKLIKALQSAVATAGAPLSELPSAVPAAATQRDPRSYTPKHLADRILQIRSALEGERKQVTVLFADIQDSMALASALDPETWHSVLDRYFGLLTDAIHRFEGTVNQYTGDGIMALFGAPLAHEDHAQRACYAALQARESLRTLADELRVSHGIALGTRIGLNSGEVVVGRIGDDLRMDYTAQGATVGTAQRIEQLAAAGTVLLSDSTANLIEGYFTLRPLGRTALKGVPDAVSLFELAAASGSRTRLEVARARGLTRFVGRQHEMDALEAALARAASGHGQVVGVVGDPGQGKSRLCHEFVEKCRARGIQVIEGRCPAHGRNIPYLPVLELYRGYLGIEPDDPAEVARQKIAGGLVLLDPGLADRLPDVFEFLGVGDPNHPAPSHDGEVRQGQLFEILHRAYRAHTAQRRLVITFIDDVHWIDPGSNAFVEQMVTATAGSYSLLLLNFRPEYVATFATKPHYQQLPLVPLGEEAIRELIASLAGADESLTNLTDRILEWAGGNPFFTEEILRALIERGDLQGRPGAYRLVSALTELEVPRNVHAVLAGRIDRLPEAAKLALQSAAVIGLHFPLDTLAEIGETTPTALAPAIMALQEADFIHELRLYPAREFTFKHPLTQEVAYRSMLQGRRSALHASVARALAARHAETLDEHAALIAHHWDEARDGAQAIRWYFRAGQRASLVDQPAARRCLQRVCELADALPPDPLFFAMGAQACAHLLTLAFRLEGDRDVLHAMFKTGERFVREAGQPELAAPLHAGYAFALGVTFADMLAFLSHTETSIGIAQAAGDLDLLASTSFIRMDALLWSGHLREALDTSLNAQATYYSGDPEQGARVLGLNAYVNAVNHAGMAQMFMGEVREARRLMERAVELAQRAGDLEVQLWSRMWSCHLTELQGNARECGQFAQRVAELARHMDTSFIRLSVAVCIARAHLTAGRWQEVSDVLTEAYGYGHQRCCGRIMSTLVIAPLARAQLALGNLERALAYAREITGFCNAVGLLYSPEPWLAMAECHIAANDAMQSRTALADAHALIERTGARVFLAQLHELRARHARAFSQDWHFEAEISSARRHYDLIEAPFHVARIDSFSS